MKTSVGVSKWHARQICVQRCSRTTFTLFLIYLTPYIQPVLIRNIMRHSRLLTVSIFITLGVLCSSQYASPGYGYSYPASCGGCGLGGGCGGYRGCGLYKGFGCGCGCSDVTTIQCDPCLKGAILNPLSGPGSPFCGACCDPISACLMKKLRDYALDKRKTLADVIIKKNILASKLLC